MQRRSRLLPTLFMGLFPSVSVRKMLLADSCGIIRFSRGLWLKDEAFITGGNAWRRIIYRQINGAYAPLFAELLFGASLALTEAKSHLTAEAALFPRSRGPTRAVVGVLTYA